MKAHERIRVIIADDQKSARRGLEVLLSYLPEVEIVGEAENGRDVLELLHHIPADIVLLDIVMPIMNGIEVVQAIRRQQIPVKVIALSVSMTAKQQALAAGVDLFISKSDDGSVLIQALRDMARDVEQTSE